MRRCLHLAEMGRGFVSPNPMVGAILVRSGKVIGEGYHRKFGKPHAEREAIHAASRAAGATLYVNLEPCNHFGKTPPCTDLIIGAGIRRVVIGCRDENPVVRGKGIRRLERAGISVKVGVLERECLQLNEVFYKFITTRLPFVGMKVAQTLDGRIADSRGHSQWITNSASRTYVHVLRSRYDAVLVGANTVNIDNPRLTSRIVAGRDPHRIVLDGNLSSELSARIFEVTQPVRVIIIASNNSISRHQRKVRALRDKGVEVVGLKADRTGCIGILTILRRLGRLGISSILVEGGSTVFGAFLDSGEADKLHLFISKRILGGGLSSFSSAAAKSLNAAPALRGGTLTVLDGDFLIEGYLDK